MDTANRRLIRPSLIPAKEPVGPRRNLKPKSSPPDQTNAESFYYVKQMATRTPMVIVLSDGETFQGIGTVSASFTTRCEAADMGKTTTPAARRSARTRSRPRADATSS